MNNPTMFGRTDLTSTFLSLVETSNEMPQVVCGWCGLEIRPGIHPTSHGICPDCLDEQRIKLRQLKETGLKPLVVTSNW